MSRVGTTQRDSSTSASRTGVEPSLQVEVLNPSDSRGINARKITGENVDPNYARRTAQKFSQTSASANPPASTNQANNQTQTNSNQNPNEASGENAFENMIGRGRTAMDKAGTTLMWGAGGFAGLLYLGLGWKKLAMIIGGLGVGAGYLLKTKLAKVGEEPNHDQQIVDAIKAKKLPQELEREIFQFLRERLKT
jgi:hypothetical protein